MRKFLAIFLLIVLVSPAWADLKLKGTNNNPEGVFRRSKNGEIVQLDKDGKKIGVYKIIHGRFVKVR